MQISPSFYAALQLFRLRCLIDGMRRACLAKDTVGGKCEDYNDCKAHEYCDYDLKQCYGYAFCKRGTTFCFIDFDCPLGQLCDTDKNECYQPN